MGIISIFSTKTYIQMVPLHEVISVLFWGSISIFLLPFGVGLFFDNKIIVKLNNILIPNQILGAILIIACIIIYIFGVVKKIHSWKRRKILV